MLFILSNVVLQPGHPHLDAALRGVKLRVAASAAVISPHLRAQAEEAGAGAVHTGRHQPRLDQPRPDNL